MTLLMVNTSQMPPALENIVSIDPCCAQVIAVSSSIMKSTMQCFWNLLLYSPLNRVVGLLKMVPCELWSQILWINLIYCLHYWTGVFLLQLCVKLVYPTWTRSVSSITMTEIWNTIKKIFDPWFLLLISKTNRCSRKMLKDSNAPPLQEFKHLYHLSGTVKLDVLCSGDVKFHEFLWCYPVAACK